VYVSLRLAWLCRCGSRDVGARATGISKVRERLTCLARSAPTLCWREAGHGNGKRRRAKSSPADVKRCDVERRTAKRAAKVPQ
jgi:hypothetical protein